MLLGIERPQAATVAVDAVFDSVSVATTFKEDSGREGDHLLFVRRGGAQNHPELVRKYIGTVVPYSDNFLRHVQFSAVFSDGSVSSTSPKGCEVSDGTVARISASTPKNTGQFERTLIVAEEGSLSQLP